MTIVYLSAIDRQTGNADSLIALILYLLVELKFLFVIIFWWWWRLGRLKTFGWNDYEYGRCLGAEFGECERVGS